jgi:hypothetical protein
MKKLKERIIYIFNRVNFSKVLVIFVVGFVSRVLVNNFWNVNVFVDYLNSISLGYYSFMAIFLVLVHELFSYIDLKLLPKISMDVFSISSIRKAISVIISNIGNKDKVPISGNLGVDKVLDKSDKVKVSGVLLKGGIKMVLLRGFLKLLKVNLTEVVRLFLLQCKVYMVKVVKLDLQDYMKMILKLEGLKVILKLEGLKVMIQKI